MVTAPGPQPSLPLTPRSPLLPMPESRHASACLVALPAELLRLVALHVRSADREAANLPQTPSSCVPLTWSPDGTVTGGPQPVPATTLVALRRTCRTMQAVVDGVLHWHLDVEVSCNEIGIVNVEPTGVTLTRTSPPPVSACGVGRVSVLNLGRHTPPPPSPLRDPNDKAVPPLAVSALYSRAGARRVVLNDVRSLTVGSPRECALPVGELDIPVVLHNMLGWFPCLSTLNMTVPVNAYELGYGLEQRSSATLTTLTVKILPGGAWDKFVPKLSLPQLRHLDVTIVARDEDDLDYVANADADAAAAGTSVRALPLTPQLLHLRVAAPTIHADLVRVYVARVAATLLRLELDGDVIDLPAVAHCVPAWPALREVVGATTFQTVIMAAAGPAPASPLVDSAVIPRNFLPSLRSIVYKPCDSLTAPVAPALTMPLATLSKIILWDAELPKSFLDTLPAYAPNLAHLDLFCCRADDSIDPDHVTPDDFLVFPALRKLGIGGTVLMQYLIRTVTAPVLDHLEICVNARPIVPDLPWPSLTVITVLNANCPVGIRADALDSLRHLKTLRLLPDVEWVDGRAPVLPALTNLTATTTTLATLAPPRLRTVTASSSSTAPLTTVLPGVRQVTAPVLDASVVEYLSRTSTIQSIAASYIDPGTDTTPRHAFTLEYAPRRAIWSVLPRTTCTRPIADQLTVQVARVEDVCQAVREISAVAAWWRAASGAWPPRSEKGYLQYPIAVAVGNTVDPRVGAELLDVLERERVVDVVLVPVVPAANEFCVATAGVGTGRCRNGGTVAHPV
ncbi:hypothetical protein AMAG_16116 [Allomyces macrogynus ATCC 38327]|uniref:Uncharacterized protein n=1 Tax=Allomyces macrogynus (strain ATCC 38327) TaxID=578462 RepID=A0A0L0TAT1_ALLM3|nr:hypothetical protein AMAG_16116 [Allomyces macrogynus ATCC 38327]|eukprot:KNE71810.1 hypothetical protein AMAG_16116 [Allomyces macrogynus ATCC 38327]